MEHSGWCGQAVASMTLAAVGVRISQRAIGRHIYMPGFGTTQQALFAYLSKYFQRVGFKENSRLRHLRSHLSRGHIVIVSWWDDLEDNDYDNGHYTLVQSIHHNGARIRMIDPTEDRRFWDIKTRVFLRRWYDYLDVHNTKRLDRWLMWIDPESKVLSSSRRSS